MSPAPADHRELVYVPHVQSNNVYVIDPKTFEGMIRGNTEIAVRMMRKLSRRLRGCMTGIRAQAFSYGSPELVALELYLMSRAAGMPIETPAVRP